MTRENYELYRQTENNRESSSGSETELATVEEASLEEAINQFEYASEVEGKADKTLEQYEYVFEKFLDFLSDNPPISSISPSDVRGFLKRLLGQDLAKATVAIHHRVLQAFFNWLVDEGLLEKAPTANIKEPKTPKKYPRILNKNQTNKLIQAARGNKGSWAGYRNFTIIHCFLDMGLRLNELINASLIDLNFNERTLKVRGKGAKDRIVYFGYQTYKLLRKWVDKRDNEGEPVDETIFISQSGEKLKTRYVQHIVSRLQEEAGLEDTKVSPHVLRHTAATLAVRNGMGTFALKRFFGWESIRTAMRYVHMNGEAVKESFQNASPMDNLKNDGKKDG